MVMKTSLIAVACLVGALAYAHHSPAATYFLDQQAVIHGTVKEFLLRNPHSYLLVEAPDETGTMQRWAIEWGGGGQLSSRGVTRDTLKAGDEVWITIMPGKMPEGHRGLVKILRQPSDGFEWGTRPGEDLTHWPLGGKDAR